MFAALLVLSCIMYPVDKSLAVASLLSQRSTTTDHIVIARQHFDKLQSYQVLIRSSSVQAESKIIRYSYKKPGFIRMDFTQPHPGAVLTYNPVSNNVKLWPFGLGTLPVLNLSPTNSLIKDERGHRVDQSDIGALLDNIRHLQREGKTAVIGEESVSGRSTTHVYVTGPGTMVVDGVHRYDVWFDNYHRLPVKVLSYDAGGKWLETVLMDAMIINIRFPVDFFTP